MLDPNSPYAPDPFGDSHKGMFSMRFYRDPGTITALLLVFLACAALSCTLAAIVDTIEWNVLKTIRAGAFESEEAQEAAVDASDIRVGAAAIFQFFFTVGSGIVFLFWTYRICKNAHCLSRRPLPFGPGWAVGYYFIPILNLFRPFEALRDADRAAVQPDDWRSASTNSLLPPWWVLHLVAAILNRVHSRLLLPTTDETPIESLVNIGLLGVFADLSFVVLNVMSIFLVIQIRNNQRSGYAKRTLPHPEAPYGAPATPVFETPIMPSYGIPEPPPHDFPKPPPLPPEWG